MPAVVVNHATTRFVQRGPDYVYIGRPSRFGNPFVIGKDGTRAEVIEKYRDYFYANPVLMQEAISELAGKRLGCYCAPKACHGDVLAEYVNAKARADPPACAATP